MLTSLAVVIVVVARTASEEFRFDLTHREHVC
jgi:hypothetical protein